jgi:GH25 family lysozyme M1 (1,4-beta-N-acetylmuramidase)
MNYTGIFGFDISTWQDSPSIPGVIDFQKMRDYGGRFVIIKAGQGNWQDPDFDVSWKNAKGILPRATYWFYDNRYPPKEQAEKYFEIIKGDLEGMCWLDLEDRQVGIYSGWRGWYDFIVALKEIYPGVQIGIYSNFFYIVEMFSFATREQREYFGKYPLWLANYGADPFKPDYSRVFIPLPWLEYLMLQTGTPAIGLEVGVESHDIDYNQFNGDETKYRQYFGGITEPPTTEPPTEPGDAMIGKVLLNLNIRPTPGVSLPAIGQLAPNDIVEASTEFSGWWKLTKWTRAGVVKPLPATDCYAYEGVSNGYIQEITPPEPEPIAIPEYLIAHFADGTERRYLPE